MGRSPYAHAAGAGAGRTCTRRAAVDRPLGHDPAPSAV